MEKDEKKVQVVSAIKEGTVLDHLPAHRVHRIVSILNLRNEMTTIGMNLSSSKHGKKSLIKVADRFLDENEVDKISILAPNATLNIIKDYKVVEKTNLKIRDTIEGVIRCSNPNCITNVNSLKTRFYVLKKEPSIKVKCAFCERTMGEDELKAHLN